MDAPPGTGRPPVSDTSTPVDRLAPPLHRRMAAWLYEGVLLFGVLAAASAVFSITLQMRSGIDPRRPFLFAFLVLVLGAYFVYCWTRGQTLPQKTWDIRVVDRHGNPPSAARAILRYACSWLWLAPLLLEPLGLALPLSQKLVLLAGWVAVWAVLSRFHPQRQFWHDALAGTRLVHVDHAPKVSRAS